MTTDLDEERRICGLSDIRARNNNAVLERIKKILPEGSKRLLDVGAGLGFFLEDASAQGFDVSGIEPDPNVVEVSRKTGLNVRHGYFPDCLQAAEVFDVIAFNDVLEHIPDLTGTLDACTAHLASGGLLILNCPNRRGIFYRIADLMDRVQIHGPFDRLWQRDLPSPHVWYFESADLRQLGERHGLSFAAQFDLLPVAFRGIWHRIFYVRNQSIIMSCAALVATLLLMPFLAVLPRDITIVMLRNEQD